MERGPGKEAVPFWCRSSDIGRTGILGVLFMNFSQTHQGIIHGSRWTNLAYFVDLASMSVGNFQIKIRIQSDLNVDSQGGGRLSSTERNSRFSL